MRGYAATAPEALEAVCQRLIFGESLSVSRTRACAGKTASADTPAPHPKFREPLRLARQLGANRRADEAIAAVYEGRRRPRFD